MPTVCCPACARLIRLPEEELALPSIQCARCLVHLRPADHVARPEAEQPTPAAQETVRFLCSGCGAAVTAPAGKAGARSSCPRCGRGLVVPPPVQARDRPAPSSPPPPAAVPVEPPPRPALEPSPLIHFSCPTCGHRLSCPEALAGAKRFCESCGQRLQVPPPTRNRTILARPEPPPDLAVAAVASPPRRDLPEVLPWSPEDERDDWRDRRLPANRGVAVMVVGIISAVGYLICVAAYWPSLVICLVMGPIAWVMGHQDLRGIRDGQLDPEGKSYVLAGYICGIVSTVLSALTLLACMLVAAMVARLIGSLFRMPVF